MQISYNMREKERESSPQLDVQFAGRKNAIQ